MPRFATKKGKSRNEYRVSKRLDKQKGILPYTLQAGAFSDLSRIPPRLDQWLYSHSVASTAAQSLQDGFLQPVD